MMVKIGYTKRDKDGKEQKIEVTVDTRDPEKKTEPPAKPEPQPDNNKDKGK